MDGGGGTFVGCVDMIVQVVKVMMMRSMSSDYRKTDSVAI